MDEVISDKKEERAGRDAMVQHLIDRTLHADLREGEHPEHHESHVGDRRVSDESLDVRLHHRDEGAVDDSEHREDDEDVCVLPRRFREEVERNLLFHKVSNHWFSGRNLKG